MILKGLSFLSKFFYIEYQYFGYTVLKNHLSVGQVTSGTWSPTLKEPIALAYVSSEHAQVNTELQVEIRGKEHPALIVKKPFYRKSF